MSTGSRPFTYPQIEGTLLERILHNLRLHDTEYNHLTPKVLFDELAVAIDLERAAKAPPSGQDDRPSWSAVPDDRFKATMDPETVPADLGGARNLIEVLLRSILNADDLDYVHKRALEGLRALGKGR